jgi:GNAT superfamily N-acetyltransferase
MEAAEFHVRVATDVDAHIVASIKVSSWRAGYIGIVPSDVLAAMDVDEITGQWEQILRDAPSNGGCTLFVAGPDGTVGGFASVCPYQPTEDTELGDDPDGEPAACYLDPAWWGNGAGDSLLRAAEAELRRLGHRDAGLWVFEQNPRARRFYERNGWSDDGVVERRIPIGDANPARVRYRKNLTS